MAVVARSGGPDMPEWEPRVVEELPSERRDLSWFESLIKAFSRRSIESRIAWIRNLLSLTFNREQQLPDCVVTSKEDLETDKKPYGMVVISGVPSPGPYNVGRAGHCNFAPSLKGIVDRLQKIYGEEAVQIFLQQYAWTKEVPHPTRGEKGYEDLTAIYGYHEAYEGDPEYRGKVIDGAVKRILAALQTTDTVFVFAHSYGNNVTLDALNDPRLEIPPGKKIVFISMAPAFDHLWRDVSQVCPHRKNGEISRMVEKIGKDNIFVVRVKGDPLSGLPDDFPVAAEELPPDLCIDPTLGTIGHVTVTYRKAMLVKLKAFLEKVLQK